jgi:lysozyme
LRLGALSFGSILATLLGCAALASATEFPKDPNALTPGIFLDESFERALPPGVPPRPVSAQGIAITKAAEGWRSRLYNDAGSYCSIGYGHLIKKRPCDGSEPAAFLQGLTEPAGEVLLRGDMENSEIAVMTMVTVPLTDAQYASLADFVFNIGSGNFGRSRLLQVVNGGPDRYGEIRYELLRWVKAGGTVFPGLRTRRTRESNLFFEGIPEPRVTPPAELPLLDIRTGEESR